LVTKEEFRGKMQGLTIAMSCLGISASPPIIGLLIEEYSNDEKHGYF